MSSDGHAGPRLVEDLRPYCPSAYLDAFDRYATEKPWLSKMPPRGNSPPPPPGPQMAHKMELMRRCVQSSGHHDMGVRLREMDVDGVAAEVIYHGTHNMERLPFVESVLHLDPTQGDCEMLAVGMRIYSQWLADAVRAAPERLIGLVTPPLWDPEASVREIEWAAKAGLRGVYLVAPRDGILPYDRPEWERFWAACQDHGMSLHTHSGGPQDVVAPHYKLVMQVEYGGWKARSALARLLFSGVFQRYPRLTITFTEQNFDWWVSTAREYDSAWYNERETVSGFLPRRPSEYMASNVFIGASMMAPFEARDAVEHDYAGNVIWGRDYPHMEGTWTYDDGAPAKASNGTRLSLRYACAGLPMEDIRAMLGENAIRAWGLDRAALATVAHRIDAPSVRELSVPIEKKPEYGGALAFRTVGAWF